MPGVDPARSPWPVWLRAEIQVYPARTVPSNVYAYGRFLDPKIPEVFEGIDPASPLYGWREENQKFWLCWEGVDDPEPDWTYPRVCDATLAGPDSSGLEFRFIPQYNKQLDSSRLTTIGHEDLNRNYIYQTLNAEIQQDNTVLVTFTQDRDWKNNLNLIFTDVSTERHPGVKEVQLEAGPAARKFKVPRGWELDYFYACRIPKPIGPDLQLTYRTVLYLSNPYESTTDKDKWKNIPCQLSTLKVHYWYETQRPRIYSTEDPSLYPENAKRVVLSTVDSDAPLINGLPTTRYAPWVIRFTDEDGRLEPSWTKEELRDRARMGKYNYVRDYIKKRRRRWARRQGFEADTDYSGSDEPEDPNWFSVGPQAAGLVNGAQNPVQNQVQDQQNQIQPQQDLELQAQPEGDAPEPIQQQESQISNQAQPSQQSQREEQGDQQGQGGEADQQIEALLEDIAVNTGRLGEEEGEDQVVGNVQPQDVALSNAPAAYAVDHGAEQAVNILHNNLVRTLHRQNQITWAIENMRRNIRNTDAVTSAILRRYGLEHIIPRERMAELNQDDDGDEYSENSAAGSEVENENGQLQEDDGLDEPDDVSGASEPRRTSTDSNELRPAVEEKTCRRYLGKVCNGLANIASKTFGWSLGPREGLRPAPPSRI
ncbi:hypothetical protein ABW19_dt0202724 [Dactylella cylindrospora]|nr:hypothetical protein ABW19_dt0202724 [Dactylella cylindrospora]